MAEPTSPQRKTITENFWDKLSGIQKVLLIAIVLFPFYVAFTTAKVPNYQCNFPNGTKTYPPYLTQTTNTTYCGLLYPPEDIKVPKNSMSNTQALIESIMILSLFFSLLSKKELGRISIPDAIRMVKADLRRIQTLPTLAGEHISLKDNEFELPTGVITRYREDKGEWKPFRYTIGMKIIDKIHNVEHYYKGMFHPMNGFFDGFVVTDNELRDRDLCSSCGKEYDIAGITEREVQKFGELRRGMSGQSSN